MSDNDLKSNIVANKKDTAGIRGDLNETLSLAKDRFGDNNFQAAIDSCEIVTSLEISPDSTPAIIEAYYLWCLACLKMNRFDEVLDVCSKSRVRFGHYLDLAYFELIAVAAKGAVLDVPGLAETYMSLWSEVEKGAEPSKNHTFGIAGQVLLMWGQALEQLRSPDDALAIYKKYLLFHPEDTDISNRVTAMESPNR